MRPCLERCPDCPSRNLPLNQQKKVVGGVGPRNARVFFLAESPGKQEGQMGIPLVGKTGQEMNNTYLPVCGLSREDVWLDNTVKCHWADSGDPPPLALVKSCSEFHVAKDLNRINPEILVLMGGIANSLIGLNIDTVHGTARYGELFGWKGLIFSSYHPALGLHIGSKMQNLLDDFAKLKQHLRGELEPLVDEYPNPAYYDLTTEEQVDGIMDGMYGEPIAVDTESRLSWKGTASTKRYTGWCATFCITPGEAFMVRVSNPKAFARFGFHLCKFRKVIMHNAPHDMRVLGYCGVDLDWDRVADTMSMLYILANLPKGLKSFSYQLLGVTAKSFEDVTRPYGVKAAAKYFRKASKVEWAKPEQKGTGIWVEKKCKDCKGTGVVAVGKGKARKCYECSCNCGFVTEEKMSRKQGLNQKIKRLLTDFRNKGDEVDYETRFEEWGEEVRPLTDKLGYPPLPSVDLVPDDEIIQYSGLDAHSTRRIYPILRTKMVELRRSYNGVA